MVGTCGDCEPLFMGAEEQQWMMRREILLLELPSRHDDIMIILGERCVLLSTPLLFVP